MRQVNISEYGKRSGFLRSFTAGEGYMTGLHFPSNPSMKHAFTKMLCLIKLNKFKTRKEILDFYNSNSLIRHICSYGNSFTPFIDHYWSDLHRYGYIIQYKEGRKVFYTLSEKAEKIFEVLPKEEKQILLNIIH